MSPIHISFRNNLHYLDLVVPAPNDKQPMQESSTSNLDMILENVFTEAG